MIATPTLKDVQGLADHPRGEGMVVSCYVDASVSSGVRSLWREHLKNEVKRIGETLADDPAARAVFQGNIAAIEKVLASRRLASTRGMAVFAASQQNLLQSFTLAIPVPNRLIVNEEPYLVPLLKLPPRRATSRTRCSSMPCSAFAPRSVQRQRHLADARSGVEWPLSGARSISTAHAA
jgi:hypothetical protein